jgi:hypothetical protein
MHKIFSILCALVCIIGLQIWFVYDQGHCIQRFTRNKVASLSTEATHMTEFQIIQLQATLQSLAQGQEVVEKRYLHYLISINPKLEETWRRMVESYSTFLDLQTIIAKSLDKQILREQLKPLARECIKYRLSIQNIHQAQEAMMMTLHWALGLRLTAETRKIWDEFGADCGFILRSMIIDNELALRTIELNPREPSKNLVSYFRKQFQT